VPRRRDPQRDGKPVVVVVVAMGTQMLLPGQPATSFV
jgi:hypothetical protein